MPKDAAKDAAHRDAINHNDPMRAPNPPNKHLRVTPVELAPKAFDYVHLAAPQLDVSVLPSQIADAFGVTPAALLDEVGT